MKITAIELRRENLELTRPYTIAYKTTSSTENLFLLISGENGLRGIGATNPSKWVVGETLDDTMAVINEIGIEHFVGRDIRELPLLCQELMDIFPNNPGARVAYDIAFHDLFGKWMNKPVVSYYGQYVKGMATSNTIGIKGVEETVAEAVEYFENGFQILKVKLGHSVEEDIERLIKIRERLGNKMGIRVDANQGYTLDDVRVFYAKTMDLDIELIEQPIKVEEMEAIRELPMEVRAKIAADESLINAVDAFKLVNPEPLCGIFNIKLMKCGGIYEGRRMADIAKLAGVELMWGCNDESIVSITAGLHVAFSSPQTKYIDLDGSLDLASDMVSGGFTLENGVMAPILDKAGLGFEWIGG